MSLRAESPSPTPARPPDDASAPRAPLRVPAVVRDVLLVVLGAALALGVDEWRDGRQREERVRAALAGIRDEIRANAARVRAARERHVWVADTLQALRARGAMPAPQIYTNPMFNPALVTTIAWQAARETGALADMELATVLRIAPAYEAQERYRALGEALVVQIMADVRRDGIDAVVRDGFAQFIPLATDFGNRERVLLERYDSALVAIPARPR